MKSTVYLCCFIVFFHNCLSQDYGLIDDIPIENYDPIDRQENDMDLELLPRREGRGFSSDEEPKEIFFRSLRLFSDEDGKDFETYDSLPRPSFPLVITTESRRRKRNSDDSLVNTDQQTHNLNGIVKNLGKPLEIMPLNTKNLTESRTIEEDQLPENTNILINDFIRFRRSALGEVEKKDLDFSSKKGHISQKLIMLNPETDNSRKSREIYNQPWLKRDRMRKNDDFSFDDNMPSSNENVRIPRVNFVTQKFTDNGLASTAPRSLNREPRTRSVNRDVRSDIGQEEGSYDGRMRMFDRMRPYYRDDYRYDPHEVNYGYDQGMESYYRAGPYYPAYTQRPQKRIIYYATLPEIPRSPNVELRNRYRYDRDMHDDRFLNEAYRGRKGYPYKSRYEDDGTIPYPVKVSTDVNVREVKKNPERRIYSDVDRPRYAYNTPPYRTTDG
ncbi:uncharacterized protein LOC143197234 [Rhynchophorus ferrugineus]